MWGFAQKHGEDERCFFNNRQEELLQENSTKLDQTDLSVIATGQRAGQLCNVAGDVKREVSDSQGKYSDQNIKFESHNNIHTSRLLPMRQWDDEMTCHHGWVSVRQL